MNRRTKNNFNRVPTLAIALFLSLSILARGAFAQGGLATDLDNELSKFATRTLAFLAEQELETMTIGSITGTGKGSIPGGPGIAVRLARAFDQAKPGVISDTAVWSIEGRMLFGDANAKTKLDTESVTTAELSLTVFFTLINQNTQAKVEDKVVITKLSQAPFFVGTTFHTSPQADIKTSRRDFVHSLTEAPFIDSKYPSRVRANADSPFALELRAKPIGAEAQAGIPISAKIDSRPGIIATMKQPFAFAPLNKNQEYEIFVYNDSSEEIAAVITVDGIDVFTFSEDVDPKTKKSLYAFFVLAPHSKLELPGWHKTVGNKRDDNFLAFLVTEYGKGARSKLFPQQAADGTVGAVTVGICKTVQLGGSKSPQSETGFGRPIKRDQTPLERTIASPHVFITVRYDR